MFALNVMHKNIIFGVLVAQHFLLSAAARTLSLASVARMSDDEAAATFRRIRWADNAGAPYCPQCGCLTVKKLGTRPVWKCRGCEHQFSSRGAGIPLAGATAVLPGFCAPEHTAVSKPALIVVTDFVSSRPWRLRINADTKACA